MDIYFTDMHSAKPHFRSSNNLVHKTILDFLSLYFIRIGSCNMYVFFFGFIYFSLMEIKLVYIVLSKYCRVGLLPFDVFNNYEFHIQQYGLRLFFFVYLLFVEIRFKDYLI